MKTSKTLLVIAGIVIAVIALSLFAYYYQSVGTRNIIDRSKYIVEYSSTNSGNSAPLAITSDASGKIWFALGKPAAIEELIPSDGSTHQFALPGKENSSLYSWGIAYDNSSNQIWFTDSSNDAVWSFNATNQKFVKYQLPSQSFPFNIVVDSNGNVWFTEFFSNKLGEITTSHRILNFTVPPVGNITDVGPSGLTIDSSGGTLWFAETYADAVGSFHDGEFKTYPLGNGINSPTGIAVDQEGNIWLTQHGPSFISEFNPKTGYFGTISTSIPPLNSSLPYFVQVDKQGNIWFNEHYGNAIARYNPANDTLVEYRVPTRISSAGNISGVLTFCLTSAGVPWFTEIFSGKVGMVNTTRPVSISMAVPGGEVNIVPGDSANITLTVSGSNNPVILKNSFGNYTYANFTSSFVPLGGIASFESVLQLHASSGAKLGTYYLTITASDSEIAVSRIIALRVT